eukprot:1975277-Pyramimonas_sp.AAC.1
MVFLHLLDQGLEYFSGYLLVSRASLLVVSSSNATLWLDEGGEEVTTGVREIAPVGCSSHGLISATSSVTATARTRASRLGGCC